MFENPKVVLVQHTANFVVEAEWKDVLETSLCQTVHRVTLSELAPCLCDVVVLLGVSADLNRAKSAVEHIEYCCPGVPIIILTAHADPEKIAQFKGATCTVLSTSVEEKKFLETLAELTVNKVPTAE